MQNLNNTIDFNGMLISYDESQTVGNCIDLGFGTEKTKAIILDKDSNRGFAYSKDGLRKVIEAEGKIMEEWDQKLFDIETYVCTDLPELTEEQLVLIDGILK